MLKCWLFQLSRTYLYLFFVTVLMVYIYTKKTAHSTHHSGSLSLAALLPVYQFIRLSVLFNNVSD